jgi:NAD(P)-dependent dehydrogenase (short-subunit alcohol dehydrogenase family)
MVEQSTGLERIGRPEEIAWPCIFLAAAASSYVTGQTISIDGGPRSSLFVQ